MSAPTTAHAAPSGGKNKHIWIWLAVWFVASIVYYAANNIGFFSALFNMAIPFFCAFVIWYWWDNPTFANLRKWAIIVGVIWLLLYLPLLDDMVPTYGVARHTGIRMLYHGQNKFVEIADPTGVTAESTDLASLALEEKKIDREYQNEIAVNDKIADSVERNRKRNEIDERFKKRYNELAQKKKNGVSKAPVQSTQQIIPVVFGPIDYICLTLFLGHLLMWFILLITAGLSFAGRGGHGGAHAAHAPAHGGAHHDSVLKKMSAGFVGFIYVLIFLAFVYFFLAGLNHVITGR